MEEAIIYTERINSENVRGLRLPYFYLHCKAEEIDGYDCCTANIYAFHHALMKGLFLANLISEKGDTYRCIVYVTSRHDRNEGLICLIDDYEGIEHMLTEYHQPQKTLLKYRPTMYEHFWDELKEKYPKTYKTIYKCVESL